jgi:hypothetical protein
MSFHTARRRRAAVEAADPLRAADEEQGWHYFVGSSPYPIAMGQFSEAPTRDAARVRRSIGGMATPTIDLAAKS